MRDDIVFGAFIWNVLKNQMNIARHGLAFEDAIQAFSDPRRLILDDDAHSLTEVRFFCIGMVGHRVATVRFTWRFGQIRIFGAGYWRKGEVYYEQQKKI